MINYSNELFGRKEEKSHSQFSTKFCCLLFLTSDKLKHEFRRQHFFHFKSRQLGSEVEELVHMCGCVTDCVVQFIVSPKSRVDDHFVQLIDIFFSSLFKSNSLIHSVQINNCRFH